jgi:hypothetical protein
VLCATRSIPIDCSPPSIVEITCILRQSDIGQWARLFRSIYSLNSLSVPKLPVPAKAPTHPVAQASISEMHA